MAETKQKYKEISKYGHIFKETPIKEDVKDGHWIYKVEIINRAYEIEIKFDSGRSKYQAWITNNDKRMSLSFFPAFKVAYDNLYKTISYYAGVNSQNNNNNIIKGD